MVNPLRGLLVITFIILAFSALVHPASSAIFSSSEPGTLLIIHGNDYAPDELIVRFIPEIANDEVNFQKITDHIHALLGTAMKKDLGKSGMKGIQIVQIPGSLSVQEALTLYRNNPFVLYAEPNYQVSILTTPNDPSFSQQWALHNTGSDADIDAPEAWDITTGSSDVVIAVIDTGVDYSHPDLAANIWTNPDEIAGNGIDDDRNGYVDDIRGWDFVNNDNNPADDNGHGTHCAGIIGAAGNNGAGTSGVNWRTKIMPLKFLGASGSGSMSDAAEAIWYAQRNGAYITSNSYGGTGFSQTMKDAIDGTGILVVCAAGNNARNNDQTPMYPASYTSPNVISVAATDRSDNLATYSNYGAVSVDVAAPGSGIYSTYRGGVYTTLSGTSMATPHVAGIAGLIRSVRPDLNAAGIKNAIMDGVDKKTQFSANTVSKGRANAYGALSMVTVTDHCTVTAISPSSGLNTGITPLESISGNGFDPGAQVRLRKAGQADIEGATVTIVSGSRITCTFDLNGKQAGSWDVVVTNPDEQSGTLTGGFTITTPPPPPVLSVTGISPAGGYSNGSIAITSLTGTAFASGYIPSLRKTGQADINGTGITIVSSTKITCTFNLTGKQTGIWDVIVTTPDGQFAILPGAFTISAPPPPPSISVTGITPNTGFNNGTVKITDLKGAGFVTGSNPSLRRSGQADINGTGISIVSSTKITCTFNLNGKQAGAWDIVVTKPDGQSATLPGGFTVATPPAKLGVTGITPNNAKRGTTVTITNLAGTGFTSGAEVRLQKTGKSDIVASNVVAVSASKITAKFTIPASTTPGYWNVRVTTPDGRTAVKNYAFNVRY